VVEHGRNRDWFCAVNAWIGASTARERLVSEVAAGERQRKTSRARIKWMFTTDKARDKMGAAYPKLSTKES
jgi:hypothetical protein